MKHAAHWSITPVKRASSSSDLVRDAARKGADQGVGFLVEEQTAGRGRRGAHWASQKGGMYYSVLLCPTIPSMLWFGFSFVASLAIRDVIAARLPDYDIALKWPNDVFVRGEGKICGILIEASGNDLIIGTGVNIAPIISVEGAKQPAVAMADFDARTPSPLELAEAYKKELARRCYQYQENGFAPVRQEWLTHCLHLDAPMVVDPGKGPIKGVFHDLGEDGTLHLLADDGQMHHISTGDVALLGAV
jgi:BirA family biotin operon repressor/biotin-[acetyl-CoA-carboxylase] ligase